VEIYPNLLSTRRRDVLALSAKLGSFASSIFSFSSESHLGFGGAFTLPLGKLADLGVIGYRGEESCAGIWLRTRGKRGMEIEIGGNGRGVALESRCFFSGKGGKLEIYGWRHTLGFSPDLGRIYPGERGLRIRLSRRGRIGRWDTSGSVRMTIIRNELSAGAKSYAGAYLSVRPRPTLSGGVSFYRYLRGTPSPDYASRSLYAWASARITERIRGRITWRFSRRLYASGPRYDGHVGPELFLLPSPYIELGVGVRLRRGKGLTWRGTIRLKGRLSGYLRLSGSRGVDGVYLRVKGEL
jgi:hypothetical protein